SAPLSTVLNEPLAPYALATSLMYWRTFFRSKSNRGYGIAASSKMLACKVPFLATQAGNCNCTLPFQKPDHRCHRVLRGNLNAHRSEERRVGKVYSYPFFVQYKNMKN